MSGAVPRTSVVLPAYRAWATLPRVLEALRPQIVGSDRELVLVESSGELGPAELAASWPWARVLAPPSRVLPGAARNLGVRHARGGLVAFIDADAVPEPGWLDELERALTPRVDVVAGAILNGTPWSAVGTAGHLLEFSEWLPHRRGRPGHGASCNLLMRRSALEHGGFSETLWPGEDTVLTFPIAQAGRLAYAPRARVRHLNRTELREFVAHQRRLGVAFVVVCDQVAFPFRVFAHPSLAPLAPLLRLWAIGNRVVHDPRRAAAGLLVAPLLVVGLISWARGLRERGQAMRSAALAGVSPARLATGVVPVSATGRLAARRRRSRGAPRR